METAERIKAAREVVQSVIPFFEENFSKVESHWKRDDTRVTAADLAISKRICEFLSAAFPQDDFCSEEDLPALGEPARALRSRFAWVLDPIDGTNNFARGIPLCAVSLALLENGFPVFGILYDHAQRVILEGGKNVPLSRDGVPVKTNNPDYDRHSIISFHFPLKKDEMRELEPFTTVNAVRCQGSAALNLAYNAFGAIDGSVDYNTKIWDIAAAVAMLEASGRKIVFRDAPAFPLREVSAEMPCLRWVAGTPGFLARAREIGLI